jgi:hypothetical protein
MNLMVLYRLIKKHQNRHQKCVGFFPKSGTTAKIEEGGDLINGCNEKGILHKMKMHQKYHCRKNDFHSLNY